MRVFLAVDHQEDISGAHLEAAMSAADDGGDG
jgi:hypothetical protein